MEHADPIGFPLPFTYPGIRRTVPGKMTKKSLGKRKRLIYCRSALLSRNSEKEGREEDAD